MTRVEFSPKSTVAEENGVFRFTFYCELCDAGYTTEPICAATVEAAFEEAQREARPFFNRCHGCHLWICDRHYNEDVMMCTDCAPRNQKMGD